MLLWGCGGEFEQEQAGSEQAVGQSGQGLTTSAPIFGKWDGGGYTVQVYTQDYAQIAST